MILSTIPLRNAYFKTCSIKGPRCPARYFSALVPEVALVSMDEPTTQHPTLRFNPAVKYCCANNLDAVIHHRSIRTETVQRRQRRTTGCQEAHWEERKSRNRERRGDGGMEKAKEVYVPREQRISFTPSGKEEEGDVDNRRNICQTQSAG
ncbi:hypothetical protein F2P81_019874 [Scophthalmus maximus]|uniref:Uncharacterized protein n=1 Tax=Scophthalmus maximus TaxID=52904 RepID=A0A6A4RYK3_SCOMX|nr:hypothetical protein F2P81_019874 [Scophthalmus maximus]